MNASTRNASGRPTGHTARGSRRRVRLGLIVAAGILVGGAPPALAAAHAEPSVAAAAQPDGPRPAAAIDQDGDPGLVLDGWEIAIRQRRQGPATPAPVTAAPSAVEVAPVIPVPPPSAPLPPDAVARILVPSIGMDLPVYRGGQHTIDGGVATLFDDGPGGWRDPVSPGDTGTLWIAGHHTSHGAPFLLVDQIVVGATVVVVDRDGNPHSYQIIDRAIVGTSVDPSAVYGTDGSARRLVVQTSMGRSHRLLLTGVLVE